MAGARQAKEPVVGELVARDMRVAIAAGRFNEFIVEGLVRGATDTLVRHGALAADIDTYYVPGAFELPLVVKKLAGASRYDAVIALGAVVRGATPHFDYVAGECSSGLARIALDTGVPVAFGVLTVDTLEQAIERAGTKAGNKGTEAALAAIEMVNLLRQIGS